MPCIYENYEFVNALINNEFEFEYNDKIVLFGEKKTGHIQLHVFFTSIYVIILFLEPFLQAIYSTIYTMHEFSFQFCQIMPKSTYTIFVRKLSTFKVC